MTSQKTSAPFLELKSRKKNYLKQLRNTKMIGGINALFYRRLRIFMDTFPEVQTIISDEQKFHWKNIWIVTLFTVFLTPKGNIKYQFV